MASKFFRVGLNSAEGDKKPVLAQDLETLKRKACEKWGIRCKEKVRIFDQQDTEMDEEFMEFLENGSIVYIRTPEVDCSGLYRSVSMEKNPTLVSTGNTSAEGNALAINQSKIQTLQVHQGNPPISEEEKREKLMKDLRENLRHLLTSLQTRHIPWMDKALIVDESYIDLRLISEDNISSDTKEKKIVIEDILELINKGNKFILIEGKPGFGKTTFTHRLAQLWIENKLPSFNFVFIIELRKHNSNSIEGYISNQKFQLIGQELHTEDILKALKHSKVLFIMDGVDEIPYSQKTKVSKFIQEIKEAENIQAVLTSRPTEILSELKLYFTEKVVIRGFSKKGREGFVNQYFENEMGSSDVERILKTIESNVSELCECPLMLLLFCFLIRNKPDDYELPDTLTELFKEIVNFIINRFLQKTENANTNEKLDLFEEKLNKQTKHIRDQMYSFGNIAFLAILENKVLFTEKEIQGNFLLKIGFLITLSSAEASVEPFHKSISEFFCSLFLSNLFLKDESKFQHFFPRFLSSVEKEDSLIFPFFCGLLKERSHTIVQILPEWFYFGNWANYFILFQECSPFLSDIKDLLRLNPPDLHLDLSINNNNQVVVLDKHLKQNTKISDFMKKVSWNNLNINVRHSATDYSLNHFGLDNFRGSSLDLVRINFPCQNRSTMSSICSEKPFSESQVRLLMDEILILKPKSVEITFPHSEASIQLLVERISRTNQWFNEVYLYDFCLRNEDIKEAAVVVLKQRLKVLDISNELSDFNLQDKLHPTTELHQLIQTIRNPQCVLQGIHLLDIITTKNDFNSLMDSVARLETMRNLQIKFTHPSENVVDLSQLCYKGKNWKYIELINLNMVISEHSRFVVGFLSIPNCTLRDEDACKLFSFCEMTYLRCNCQLLKAVCQESTETNASFHTLSRLKIVDRLITFSSEIFSKFNNLNFLRFDCRNGFEINKTNKEKLTTFFTRNKAPSNISFELTFDTLEYLKQIDFITDTLHSINENEHLKSAVKIEALQFIFKPFSRILNEANVTILKKRETEELLEAISKLTPFLSKGFIQRLDIKIQQSKQRGHFFGPFLVANNQFPEEEYEIQYQYQYLSHELLNYAEWFIMKKKSKEN